MRIVLDTNGLLVSIGKKSPFRIIFDSLLSQKFKLILTIDILNEYIELLEFKTSINVANNIADLLLRLPNVIESEIFFKWSIMINDPVDNKYTEAYLTGRAEYLVSNDNHFNIFQNIDFRETNIISIDEFCKILSSDIMISES